jgi:hypothetical protein
MREVRVGPARPGPARPGPGRSRCAVGGLPTTPVCTLARQSDTTRGPAVRPGPSCGSRLLRPAQPWLKRAAVPAQAGQRGPGRRHLPRLRLPRRRARERRLGRGRAGLGAEGRRRGPAVGPAARAPAAVPVVSARAGGAAGRRREARGGSGRGDGCGVAGLGAPAARAQPRAGRAGGAGLRPRGACRNICFAQ